MSKRKSTPYEVDDEFFAQIDFLRDYEEKSVNNNLL